MAKDLVNSAKICAKCGQEIKDRQDYVAVAEDFEVGKESSYDLLTKSYRWKTYHNPCPQQADGSTTKLQ